MANIYKRFKRKKRTSDSDLETISPEEEEKSLWDEASHVDDTMITDSPGEEDKIIEALDMTQSVASQLQLILSKLEALETKFETVVTTVEGLKKTVDKVQSEVAAVESNTTELRKDVDQMDNSLSYLNKEVQGLRSKKNNCKLEIKSLESNILYQEAYN